MLFVIHWGSRGFTTLSSFGIKLLYDAVNYGFSLSPVIVPHFSFKRWRGRIIYVQNNVVHRMVTSTMQRWKHGAFVDKVWLIRDYQI